jgi:alpha-glucosidase
MKFGFVNVGPQEWTAWLHEAIRKAAGHRLMIDVHDSYRPSGVTRTYPNLMTQEGVRGNEHMPTATHNATLPFTRFLNGPADYTICYYTDRIKTTRAHQIALAAAFYSPLQFMYWYDKPSDHGGEPETDFFAKVPTVWDETRVVDGRIGEFVSIARRSGEQWFTGTISGDAPREVTLPLSFLATGRKYMAHVYENGAGKKDVRVSSKSVDSTTVLTVALPAAGGHAMRIVPE